MHALMKMFGINSIVKHVSCKDISSDHKSNQYLAILAYGNSSLIKML